MHKKRPNDDDPVARICDIACEVAERHVQHCIALFIGNLARELPALIETAAQARYAGRRVPKGTAAHRALRNVSIRAEHAAGQSIAELSRRYYLGAKTVAGILNLKKGTANESVRKSD